MPAKVRQPAASTIRVRATRARKKIARLRLGRKWDLLLWALQTYYVEHDIPLTTFIRALDLHTASVSSFNIKISDFIPDETLFLKTLDDNAVEQAVLRSGTENTLLIRPKFLKDEIL